MYMIIELRRKVVVFAVAVVLGMSGSACLALENITPYGFAGQHLMAALEVDVKVAADGMITRPFKLEAGVCTTNIAYAILGQAKSEVDAVAQTA